MRAMEGVSSAVKLKPRWRDPPTQTCQWDQTLARPLGTALLFLFLLQSGPGAARAMDCKSLWVLLCDPGLFTACL